MLCLKNDLTDDSTISYSHCKHNLIGYSLRKSDMKIGQSIRSPKLF